MSAITTHVLDTARGGPAAGVPVVLERGDASDVWQLVGRGETDDDGRLRTLSPADTELPPGVYRLIFDTRKYFEALGISSFYPRIVVVFETSANQGDFHVPLLLNPFGYTTYRGS
ncbi:MAG: hydroxyisourate hydrolase [Acidobacteria bacterium]|nr:hydroxyisourate hydrolase [Acidobacteriota bacterium]MCA1651542.1 hydroxyisourate hydrolase [Acidobacteriota bacterium]